MSWMTEIWHSITTTNEAEVNNKDITTDNNKMGWNVYTKDSMTRAEFAKEFSKVHKEFKYRFIVPGLIILEKFALPEYKHEGVVPKNYFNTEWVVFEKSWNQAMEDMGLRFDYVNNMKNGIAPKDVKKNIRKNRGWMRYLKTIKQSVLKICLMDTYYHEFGMFLMHRIYQNMAKEFDGKKYNRIVYDSKKVADVTWLVMQKQVRQTTEVVMKNVTGDMNDGSKRESENRLGREEKASDSVRGEGSKQEPRELRPE